MMHFLVKRGANIDAIGMFLVMFRTPVSDCLWIEDNGGQTALHFAAQNGQTEIARSLIENGANVNATGICFGHI
jgi:hypothetical protein